MNDSTSRRAALIRELADKAGMQLGPANGMVLAAAVETLAAAVLAADAELRGDHDRPTPGYLA